MEIPLSELTEAAASYGPTAYAAVSDPQGSPRVTHVRPRAEAGLLHFGLGRRSVQLLATNPHLTLVWPATSDQSMSLIVDADVIGAASEDGIVQVRPMRAVRHRPAP
jgi:hypothetical protein